MKPFLTFLLLCISIPFAAQNYILDASFGTNGTKVFPMYKSLNHGIILNTNYYLLSYNEISKINYSGDLVTGFGTNGFLSLFAANSNFSTIGLKAFGNSIFIYGDDSDSDNNNITILKIDENGVFDTTFGTNGKVIIDFGLKESISSLVVEPSGALFCVGTRGGSGSSISMLYFKVNANGSVDTTFDSAGFKSILSGTFARGCYITPCTGGYLLVGQSYVSNSYKAMLLKVDTAGNPIPGYGTNGLKLVTIPNNCSLDEVGHDFYDNKLYLLTNAYPITHELFVYDTTTDTTLSSNSVLYSTASITAGSDGVYLSGYYSCGPGGNANSCSNKFNLRRKNLDGTADSNFQNNTAFEYNFQGGYSRTLCAIKDNAGTILLVGVSYADFAMTAAMAMLRLTPGVLGISDQAVKNNLAAYPNPFTNEVFVTTDKEIMGMELLDLAGRSVGTPKFEDLGGKLRVDLSFLSGNGTYFLKITDKQNVVSVAKIVK